MFLEIEVTLKEKERKFYPIRCAVTLFQCCLNSLNLTSFI